MKYLHSLLLTASLAAAVPTGNGTLEAAGTFQGSINFFKRWDCHNPCVEDGSCQPGQESQGLMPGSVDPLIAWGYGCLDRPDGVHSLALSISNGHGFSGINTTCAEWWEKPYDAHVYELEWADSYGPGKCNVFVADHIKAIYYHWT